VNAVSQRLFQSCHALCTLGSFKKEISEKRFNQVLKYSLKKQNLNVSINCTYINYYKVFSSVITIYHESTPQHLNLNYTPFITDLNLRELEKKKKKKNLKKLKKKKKKVAPIAVSIASQHTEQPNCMNINTNILKAVKKTKAQGSEIRERKTLQVTPNVYKTNKRNRNMKRSTSDLRITQSDLRRTKYEEKQARRSSIVDHRRRQGSRKRT